MNAAGRKSLDRIRERIRNLRGARLAREPRHSSAIGHKLHPACESFCHAKAHATLLGGDSGFGTVFKMETDGSAFQTLKHFGGPEGQQGQSELRPRCRCRSRFRARRWHTSAFIRRCTFARTLSCRCATLCMTTQRLYFPFSGIAIKRTWQRFTANKSATKASAGASCHKEVSQLNTLSFSICWDQTINLTDDCPEPKLRA